ncbi:nonsense-mediated mRNA decay factor SMG8 [Musca autumnalis]|uniref:nonsense-mediated mRNA decay factor SMG8 n=1 Tax=Musca autumnalis TaxID=221902 RepID=UPI003CEA471C
MPEHLYWSFPDDIPEEFHKILFQDDKKVVVVGVIGKSAFPDCNKMAALDVLGCHPSILKHEPQEGQIQFYFNPLESILYLHFETSFDSACMQQMLLDDLEKQKFEDFLTFNQKVRSRFARMFLFATQVCHLIVFVELSVTFDASLLGIFKALKIIRDRHVLKFFPKLLKNSNTGYILGKPARLCSPRVIFLFENLPDGHEKTKDAISKFEFDVEDNIYKMLRNEFIVVNNSNNSLFSIPVNLRFVYYNLNEKLREDPLLKSVNLLQDLLHKPNFTQDDDELEDLLPYKGFGKPLSFSNLSIKSESSEDLYVKNRKFMDLLKDHVEQAFKTGFNDNLIKFKGKHYFVLLNFKSWYEIFKMLHKLFIENPDNPEFEANDPDYKSYLENFDKILNYDSEFFKACCDIGLQKAFAMYNNPTLTYYSAAVHKKLVEEAVALYMKYARGTDKATNEAKLREMCEACWRGGKEQCEYPSLRGNPCARPKHNAKDPTEHSSGLIFISACNCGKLQGRREDPYSTRHANYEFYEYMASNCNLCAKVKRINFAVFEPSINDYRAAEFERGFPKLPMRKNQDMDEHSIHGYSEDEEQFPINNSQPLAASQRTLTNLSLSTSIDNMNKIDKDQDREDDDDDEENSSDESVNELILKVKETDAISEETTDRTIYRQPSTTEYLPGMMHTQSPAGLLPQFPSWSLCCVGASSVYSHNHGLQEHFQSGFLSGSNFLLPWDVQVRLEHSAQWAYEKTRYRKMGEVFVLKIFVGFEYECPRGHRFMMSAPDKILRGGSGILRDSGSKVVYNNMPLYFPCPCRTKKFDVAQLMRIHVVTPKAPVNVSLDPKVRTGDGDYVFVLGCEPKLTQSAYWMLRLPYIYEGDDGPIPTPTEITAANALNYGCLMAGMFGVSEVEADE